MKTLKLKGNHKIQKLIQNTTIKNNNNSISMIPKQYCAVHSIKGNTKKPRNL